MAVLKATKRDERGSRQARKLRGKGLIPCIIYGHGQEPLAVTLNEHDVKLTVLHGERLLEVTVGKDKLNALIKEVQYDTYGQSVLHMDLTRVDLHERVTVTVPVVLRGTPAGVAEGGVLQQTTSAVTIECAVRNIPDDITIPVVEMQIGDSLYARDLPLPEGAKLQDEAEMLICNVTVIAEEVEEAPAEEVEEAEPEIIGEKKEEEEQEKTQEQTPGASS